MPLAFGTILGGMTTLIGTPPNLIVSGFRAEAGLGLSRMFDFTPVGRGGRPGRGGLRRAGRLAAGAGAQAVGHGGFETGAYLTEVRVPEDSKAVGQTLRAFERALDDTGAQIVGLVRNEVRVIAPNGGRLRAATSWCSRPTPTRWPKPCRSSA